MKAAMAQFKTAGAAKLFPDELAIMKQKLAGRGAEVKAEAKATKEEVE
jgi:hypothetical protein